MIKAIIFDFDGVIVDTEKNKFKALQSILNNTGFSIKDSDFKPMLGKKTISFLSTKFPRMSQKELKTVTEQRRKLQLSNLNDKLIPGIKDLLKFLKSKELKIVITTGSTRQIVEKIIEANGIKNFFDFIISGKDFKQSKPSPECYEKTLKKLNLSSSEVIIVEDSIAGITSSKSANCKVFAIMTYLDKEALHEADKVFTDHFDILKYFKKKNIF